MVDGLYIEDERMKKAVQILQQMPDFAIDEAIANLNSLAQFAEKAAKASKKENG